MSENIVLGVDLDEYRYGFRDKEDYVFKSRKGLDHEIVDEISWMKGEPDWMRALRHKALDIFFSKPTPTWGGDLSRLDYNDIYYYIKPVEQQGRTWDEVPDSIKETFERLGIPEAERKFLAGAGAQYESEAVYHSLKEEWGKQGVVFVDSDTGLREYEDVYREHFGTVVPAADNKYAALNTATWSGGSFVYIPPGVKVEIPLQAYFRINAQNMGQFERTLIIADEGSQVHYIEGCTAPTYSTDSFHSGVIEIIVKKGARVRYTTIQNWSHNVYNLVTQRAMAHEDAVMEWVDGNLGSRLTMKYPSCTWSTRARAESCPLLCTTRAAPGRRRQGHPRRARHLVEHHQQVHQQGRRPGRLPRPGQGLQGRPRRQEQRHLRRADPGRQVALRHLPGHGDRRERHQHQSRGHGQQGE